MRLNRIIVDLDRARAIGLGNGLADLSLGFGGKVGFNVLNGSEPLHAVIADDARAFACLVWEDEIGTVTFDAVRFPLILHDAPPVFDCASVERQLPVA